MLHLIRKNDEPSKNLTQKNKQELKRKKNALDAVVFKKFFLVNIPKLLQVNKFLLRVFRQHL